MKADNVKSTFDLTEAEKVIHFRLGLWVLLCTPNWIPLVMTIAIIIPSSFHIWKSFNKYGIVDSIVTLLFAVLLYSLFMWFMFYRRIPFLYRKDIRLVVFEDRFVYIVGDVKFVFPRNGSKVYKGILNTNIISYQNSHVLVDANEISFEKLKSYIK